MANEIENANFASPTDAISALIAPSFVDSAIMFNLVAAEDYPDNTNVLKFRKSGTLTAANLGESTAYSYSASSELTETTVTSTGTKKFVASKLTVEALRFNSGDKYAQIAAEQGRALARLFDDQAITLFNGFSTQVTATNVLTIDDFLEALASLHAGAIPAGGRVAAVLDYKGAGELRRNIASTTGTPFVNERLIQVLASRPQANNYLGELAGVDVYQTSGLPLATADDVALVFSPDYAICTGMGGPIETHAEYNVTLAAWEISSHMYWDLKEYHDAAGIGLLSDT